MSELEKAKQIAAEAFNFNSKAYTTIEQQNEIIEVNRKAFMKIISLPSLTIPKSIADELDKAFEEYSEEGRMASTILSMQIVRNVSKRKDVEEWFMEYSVERLNLALAYLVGKALGVELVKVVDDD